MPWLTGWAHRKEIRYGTVFPGSNLTDFPVLLKVTTDSDIAAELSDGNGITVTAADGNTEIPFGLYPGADLSAGTFILRFLASPLTGASTGDVMAYIYYDDAETTVEDKAGVVTNDYILFAPMEEDPSGSAPQVYDWVSETNLGTSAGSMTGGDLVAAEVGNGIDMDGSNDYLDFGTTGYGALTGNCSIEMNIYPSGGSGTYRLLAGKGTESGDTREVKFYLADSNKMAIVRASSYGESTNTVTTGSWWGVALTITGTTTAFYRNGAADGTTTTSTPTAGSTSFIVGKDPATNQQYFTGIVDELKVSSVARSADWIEYAYENDFNNSDTVTLGAEEDEAGGGTTVTPTTLALVLTTYAPTVSTPVLCTPTTVALTLTTFAPTVSTPVVCTPTTLAIVTTGYEPSVNIGYTITPGTLALTLTTFAPTIVAPVTCTPTTAALTITTYAPVIDDGSGPYSNIISIVSRFP